jgi:hypothetical protein
LHFHNGDYFGGFACGDAERFCEVARRPSQQASGVFQKLITAAAGTDGMTSRGGFDLLVGIFC